MNLHNLKEFLKPTLWKFVIMHWIIFLQGLLFVVCAHIPSPSRGSEITPESHGLGTWFVSTYLCQACFAVILYTFHF
jgi:hypothetical protein